MNEVALLNALDRIAYALEDQVRLATESLEILKKAEALHQEEAAQHAAEGELLLRELQGRRLDG